jgi:hypothetical protein
VASSSERTEASEPPTEIAVLLQKVVDFAARLDGNTQLKTSGFQGFCA